MVNIYHLFKDLDSLKHFLASRKIRSIASQVSSVLVQIFSAPHDRTILKAIVTTINDNLPSTMVVGATTAGEIAEGRFLSGTIVLSFTFLEKSQLTPIAIPCKSGEEYEVGQKLYQMIQGTSKEITGVLLLTNMQKLSGSSFVKGFSSQKRGPYPVFGGGAGNYSSPLESFDEPFVFCGSEFIEQGVVAVVFSGKDLHIQVDSYLGWQSLSKEMTITESDGTLVKSVDNIKAFDVYDQYLKIPQNEDFFFNVLEFPLLVERDGQLIARVPLAINEQGALRFTDLYPGEKIRIGYGHPEMIIKNARSTHSKMQDFGPEAIFLYSCCCRRFLLQNEVNLETEPFELVAPTTGFFTYGEMHGSRDKLNLLNCSVVVVGLREGESKAISKADDLFREIFGRERVTNPKNEYVDPDPYVSSHFRITSRLMHFINAVTAELEEANQKLKVLSEVDKLTQVYNRLKLDSILEIELHQARRYNSELSIILLDMDHFKQVNDTYGHNVGDKVLWQATQILKANIRRTDSIGRWGGEEFLVILPYTNSSQARIVAEKLRIAIESAVFPIDDTVTCSFGVTSYLGGEDLKDLIKRADDALYKAKRSGRNQIVQI
ncbi:MAG: GGDEF domain-containing protein [Syntrophomonadaceae bacterium]|nr:GGDEF domain-containing protein [Syntrophomonadaceae bacterium]